MNSKWLRMALASLVSLASIHAAHSAEKSAALTITHSPVSWAIKGQPLTLRARLTGGAGGVESVTLYYALFRDAAPFRVAMTSSGMDMYVGTIEAGLLSGLSSISYYIEAQDRDGSIEETPWYDVQFKDPDASVAPGRTGGAAPVGPASAGKDDEEGVSALTIGLIAGGAAAVAAGAYLLSDSGGDSDDDGGSGGGDATNAPGTYSGNSTICRTPEGGATECATDPASIVIDANGRVFSDSLINGTVLVGSLSGSDFTLSGPISDATAGYSGTIEFNGTVAGGTRIVGSISGSFDQGGTPGAFSGTFSMNK